MIVNRQTAPYLALGTACVVAGGLVSAATAGAPTEHSAWAVAYLVLVAGVAQIGLGLGQLLSSRRTDATSTAELVLWNAGNALVLAGVLVPVGVLVDVGGALLVVALVLALYGVRSARSSGAERSVLAGRSRQWLLVAFRLLVAVLALSIPAGLILARL